MTVELFPGLQISSSDTLADIGCGGGHMCVLAGGSGAAVKAVDSNQDTLRHVSERMRGVPARSFEAHLAKSDFIPLLSQCATVVVCTEVLEHVGDPYAFLKELVRIGRPGAKYLLSVPDWMSEMIIKAVCPPSYFEPPNHVRIFKAGEFQGLVEKAGLSIIDTREVGFYWAVWWILRFGCGTDFTPGAPGEVPPVLLKWEETWQALLAMPDGQLSALRLDRALPKSQLILAQKPS